MAEVLTSVRIDEQILADLKIIASANGTSVAAEFRQATSEYIARTTKSSEFQARLEEQVADNQRRIDKLLALANPADSRHSPEKSDRAGV
jgi:predicted transcriptional regulator